MPWIAQGQVMLEMPDDGRLASLRRHGQLHQVARHEQVGEATSARGRPLQGPRRARGQEPVGGDPQGQSTPNNVGHEGVLDDRVGLGPGLRDARRRELRDRALVRRCVDL